MKKILIFFSHYEENILKGGPSDFLFSTALKNVMNTSLILVPLAKHFTEIVLVNRL